MSSNSSIQHCITLNNKKYAYSLRPSDTATWLECAAANISQPFPNEDIPALLNDLPELILAEKAYNKRQNELIRFRVSPDDKKEIEKKALKKGYTSVSHFLRDLALKA